MLNWLTSALVSTWYTLGTLIWNGVMVLVGAVAQTTPHAFSVSAWVYVTGTLLPLTKAVGAVLLNIFFYIGFIRHVSNLKEGITVEMLMETCIKVVLANVVLQNISTIMSRLFAIASNATAVIAVEDALIFTQEDLDLGAVLFYWMFGFLYFIIALVCALSVFLTVYQRYLQLYLLMMAAPIAVSTLPGGHGVANTAGAWFKTFLGKTFAVVFIVASCAIAAKLCSSVNLDGIWEGADVVDGVRQALSNMFFMVLLSGTVRGMDSFMRQTFGL